MLDIFRPHWTTVLRNLANLGRIRQRPAEETRGGALRCNSIAFGILKQRNGREEKRR